MGTRNTQLVLFGFAFVVMSAIIITKECPVCRQPVPLDQLRIHSRINGSCAVAATAAGIRAAVASSLPECEAVPSQEPDGPLTCDNQQLLAQEPCSTYAAAEPQVAQDTDSMGPGSPPACAPGEALQAAAAVLHPLNQHAAVLSDEEQFMLDADAFLLERLTGADSPAQPMLLA
jgi:hypothetical protein